MKKQTQKTTPVTTRALIQRINRKLKPENEILKTSRGARCRQDMGDYFIIDFFSNVVIAQHVDPETLGRELEVLKAWEHVAE